MFKELKLRSFARFRFLDEHSPRWLVVEWHLIDHRNLETHYKGPSF